MKLILNKSSPPLAGAIVAEYVKSVEDVEIQWSVENVIQTSKEKIVCDTKNNVLRSIARLLPQARLYGTTAVEKSEVDHWLSFSIGPLASKHDFFSGLAFLNNVLGPLTYLVAKRLTIADFGVFAALTVSKEWQGLISKKEAPVNVLRWYNFLNSHEAVVKTLNSLPEEAKAALIPPVSSRRSLDRTVSNRAQEGKFIDLPEAEMGKVVVRFPPEASGYLHIGHAKAALLNQYYQQAFCGKLIMRFDDTNPAKENVHFEKVILEDVELLELKPDLFTHTSQYFDLMIGYCEKLLKEGKAYVDDTEPETMKQQREQKIESDSRTNSVEKNFELWEYMKKGTEKGQKCCVRAKIDMQSANGCMRDPTIYRCKNEIHPRTGDQYKVYPTYDFACPIVDAVEGVTHTLRTMEYHDRDVQFYWFIEALGLRRPYIWEYSRLSMTNTVLSKRKLTWFVEQKLVDGWDDPRMPTVRGVLRRGMTVEGLKQFIIAQGSSRSVVFMEWDKIWAFNKKVIDPLAPRYTALEYDSPVPVLVNGAKEEVLSVPKHPKNSEAGTKEVWVGPRVLIDQADADALKEGENTTFINWGNLLIKKINRINGKITSVEAEPNLGNKDYKKTLKITWLGDTRSARFTPTWCVHFDHIISKPLLAKDEDLKQYIGHETRKEIQMLGDPELKKLKKGDIIQLQRRGFFKVDVAYEPLSLYICKERPIVLFSIPDGHTKENPTAGAPKQPTVSVTNNKANDISKHELKVSPPTQTENRSPAKINEEIIKQGDIVRILKAQKAVKGDIDPAIKALLTLKSEYKALTNLEWKPGCIPPSLEADNTSGGGDFITDLNTEIIAQGNQVCQLKTAKADKVTVDKEVKTLLALKTDYKKQTGKNWTPNVVPETVPGVTVKTENVTTDENSLLQKIVAQGENVRELKSKKAEKSIIDGEVKILLGLKAEYKSLTGREWKPGDVPSVSSLSEDTSESQINPVSEAVLLNKIFEQGNKLRQLKSDKADKSTIDVQVKRLLSLKSEFKTLTGKEWKPDMISATNSPSTELNGPKEALTVLINEQGNVVRTLKSNGSSKDEVDSAVKKLLDLKTEYKNLTGTDFPVVGRTSAKITKAVPKEKVVKQKQASKEKKPVDNEDVNVKKQTRLGLEAKKEENLPDWYTQVITKGELIEYYDVSGCYILRPWSFAVWEAIKDWFDAEIKKLGVQNCYFPIFVSRSVLEKEKTHIADFAPEVAWVTKSGDSDLAEPIAIRPTSETVMYPAYAKWIQSYRDLPIKLNQWNNVVRWEFKHPQPFLRTREFLWQEGHTAYASKEEADSEVKTILDLYAKIYTDLLAIPVVKGRKTEKEKFAGGDYTLTVEAYISASGRAIQGGTSHHLGQNFSKMFDIVYEDPETQEKKFVYQNSWGLTTRSIGVMIMVHADNQGLVLPPRVASFQVVIVPCGLTVSLPERDRVELLNACSALENRLKEAGVRVKGDYRDNYSPGWKFNHWELKGVPIRVELGPKDIKTKTIVVVRRDTGEKITIKDNTAVDDLTTLLDGIHKNLYDTAERDLKSHMITLTDWSEFTSNLDKKNIILAPFCGETSCEDKIKVESTRDDTKAEAGAPSMGAKSLCIPLDQPAPIQLADACIHPCCQNRPKFYTLFGRSY